MRTNYQPKLDADLLLSLQLDEGESDIAYDSSQNGWNGNIIGGVWEKERGKWVVSLNGKNDKITVPDGVGNRLGTSDFTIELYVALESAGGTLLSKGGDNWRQGKFQVWKEGAGTISFTSSAECNNGYAMTRMSVPYDGRFCHIAIVREVRDYRGYVDGKLKAKAADFFDIGADFSSNDDWIIGGIKCKVGYFRIYKRVLILAEIRQPYLRV